MPERVARFERDGPRAAVDATADNGYPAGLLTDPAKFAAFRARWLANDPVSFASIYRMLAAMDLMPDLAAIRCPVLVIGGEYDRGRPQRVVEAARSGYAACLKSPICASNARLKAGRAVQRST